MHYIEVIILLLTILFGKKEEKINPDVVSFQSVRLNVNVITSAIDTVFN